MLTHGILPFSKSYHEIESTWSVAKCRGRKSFDTWCYIVFYQLSCHVSFYPNQKQLMFFQNIFWNWKSVHARKKMFCHVSVKNYLCNVLWKFLIKIESMWGHEIKEQAPQFTLMYCGRTVRSSHQSSCIRKLFLKILQYPQETPVLESVFKKLQTFRPATSLKRDPNTSVFLLILQNF